LRLAFIRDDRGTAALEFAAVAMILVTILGNAVDFGVYEYRTMQVQEGRPGRRADRMEPLRTPVGAVRERKERQAAPPPGARDAGPYGLS